MAFLAPIFLLCYFRQPVHFKRFSSLKPRWLHAIEIYLFTGFGWFSCHCNDRPKRYGIQLYLDEEMPRFWFQLWFVPFVRTSSILKERQSKASRCCNRCSQWKNPKNSHISYLITASKQKHTWTFSRHLNFNFTKIALPHFSSIKHTLERKKTQQSPSIDEVWWTTMHFRTEFQNQTLNIDEGLMFRFYTVIFPS